MTGRTSSTATIAAADRSRRRRNILIAVALPVLLAVAYLAGMSSADARSNAIPALIVNQDEMVEQVADDGTSTQIVAGRLLVSHLMDPDNGYGFDWGLADADTAQTALERGDAHVVVTIPENFSASIASLGTDAPQQAGLVITTDQAHDYLSAQTASVLADAVVAQFGSDVTEMVAIGLVQGFDATSEGLLEAAGGAGQLADGASQLGDGFEVYVAGQQQITEGLSESASGAQQLAGGARQYVDGVDEFASGASQFASGTSTFAGGVTEYTGGVDQLASGVTDYTAGVDELAGGLAALDQGAAPLGDAATQLSDAAAGIGDAVAQLESAQGVYENEVKPGLDSVAANVATLEGMCAELPDPDRQAECLEATGGLSAASGGASAFIDGVMAESGTIADAAAGLNQLTSLSDGIIQLTGGISSAADGAAQLSAASGQLNDGASALTASSGELRTGAETLMGSSTQIVDGATQLQGAGSELTTGTDELSEGLAMLSAGQDRLTEANPEMQEGIDGLSSGATELQTGLEDGAEEASGALGDAESYADVLAHPVTADVESYNDPRFGGILAALALPIAAWVAAFVTMLARRLITPDALASTASTSRLVGRAFRRLGAPVLGATMAVALIAHIVGAPWAGLLGTITLGALLVLAVTAAHLLFTALWGRRGGAIASLVALAVQLATMRGLLPAELRAGWAEVLSVFAPLSHASAGLQLIYAGGNAGGIVMSYVALALIAIVAAAAAWLVVERKRRTSIDRLVDIASLDRTPRAPQPATA